ncbi:UDP-glucose 4-epimerase GalE [Maricaulis sp.]|uniref:UDP-glucose 4-epimerase GalE n=1 Tax=Maricaulis sp. TaxID=1486257 RepID=UPI0025B84265|nr:UDP-glucose 4-epimerase GalE [Maricaulis sp.]
MAKTVLVLGGAGYIGAHAAKALAGRGDLPVVLDNLSSGRRDFVRWGPLVEADIRDGAAFDAVFKTYRPDAVMHFAASIEVGIGERKPIEFWNNNVAGSLSVLSAMQRNRCRSIVFSSTCAVYGTPSLLPLRENHPRRPINTYGQTKLAVECALEDAARGGIIDFAALRYFNASGASPDGDIGEEHEPETHLIPNALKAAAGIGGPMQVFGTDYATRDGSCVRDFIHVDDLAAGHLLALDRLSETGESFACNLGTGRGVTVLEVLDAVEAVVGRPVPRKLSGRRPGDAPELYADVGFARDHLGFRPRSSAIGQVVQDAWRYHAPRFTPVAA